MNNLIRVATFILLGASSLAAAEPALSPEIKAIVSEESPAEKRLIELYWLAKDELQGKQLTIAQELVPQLTLSGLVYRAKFPDGEDIRFGIEVTSIENIAREVIVSAEFGAPIKEISGGAESKSSKLLRDLFQLDGFKVLSAQGYKMESVIVLFGPHSIYKIGKNCLFTVTYYFRSSTGAVSSFDIEVRSRLPDAEKKFRLPFYLTDEELDLFPEGTVLTHRGKRVPFIYAGASAENGWEDRVKNAFGIRF